MTLFAIHDESGRISQANKIYVSPEELKKYEDGTSRRNKAHGGRQ
jgi:hypothetical protein